MAYSWTEEQKVSPLFPGKSTTSNLGPKAGPNWDGVLEGIRTPDPRFRKPVLYPAELPRRCQHP